MKNIIVLMFIVVSTIGAFAEGPILNCKATREGPRSDGKSGYENIDSKHISTVIDDHIKTTQLKGAIVKTFIDAQGNYLLVISDEQLDTSSTSMGTLDNKHINLSLDGQGLSNFVSCTVK